jgi:hypothetical protein
MTIFLSLLIAIIGALVYALAGNPKLAELGRLSFAVGLLAFLLKISDPLIHILGGR